MEMIWLVEMQSKQAEPKLTCDYPDVIECRPKDGEPDQMVECSLEVGLDCIGLIQTTNGATCYDYEVRVGCRDRTMPSCIEQTTTTVPIVQDLTTERISTKTTTPTTTQKPVEETCLEYSEWINTFSPSDGLNDGEAVNVLLLKSEFDSIVKIECRNTKTFQTYDQDSLNIKCNVVSGFSCMAGLQPGKQCDDFEVRVAKIKDTEVCKPHIETTLPPVTTIPETVPTEEMIAEDDCLDYTEWLSTHTPFFGDEVEKISDAARVSGIELDEVIKIECRSRNKKLSSQLAGERTTCNLKEGLVCKHRRQDDNQCDDYEVRLAKLKPLERCGYMIPSTTTGAASTTTTTRAPIITTTEAEDECVKYGPWISTSEPDPFTGNEMEMIWIVESQSKYADPTLTCDYPDIIECRPKNGMPDQLVDCSIDVGLDCIGTIQPTNGGSCYDYEVRIGCKNKLIPNALKYLQLYLLLSLMLKKNSKKSSLQLQLPQPQVLSLTHAWISVTGSTHMLLLKDPMMGSQ